MWRTQHIFASIVLEIALSKGGFRPKTLLGHLRTNQYSIVFKQKKCILIISMRTFDICVFTKFHILNLPPECTCKIKQKVRDRKI